MTEKDDAQAAAEAWVRRSVFDGVPVAHRNRCRSAFLAGLAKGREMERAKWVANANAWHVSNCYVLGCERCDAIRNVK